ncbi:MAG TPA: sodium/proline symporter [Smithellaceae bacterium]|nr:sodium/proline symporter [Smithellaceae bacterium]HRS89150.1 sodium/proline symporter [Smithellaceae bacterium]HRV25956.1 sodium/proline symporter [Smithellaceae bacterium]
MIASNGFMIIAIVAYMVMLIVIGFIYARRNAQVGDFYLGGRKLGAVVTAMSAEASDMSSWLLMGLPGVAYLSGFADAGWTAIGLAIGTYLNWLLVARRLRRYSQAAGNAITLPEFFSNRYRDEKKLLTWIAAIVILIFFIPYTAAGFAACGKLFNSVFGIDYTTAMLIGAVVVVSYTTIGGFLAASTTDLMQGIIMSVSLLGILIFGVLVAGGIDAVRGNAQTLPGYLSMTLSHNGASGQAESYGLITIISTMAWGLGYFGMPHILLRFMAIRDEKKLVFSRRIAVTWVVISLGVAVLIGIVGQTLSANGTIATLQGSSSETVLLRIAELISRQGVLCALAAGIFLSGVLAATMSTSDSQLLVASSGVTENLIGECFGIKLPAKKTMLIARATVILIAVIAAFIARNPESSIFLIVSFAWAGFGAAFGPVMLFALFWKRSNLYGAVAGMIAGGAMVFVWKYLVRPFGGAWNIYELLPAFLFACVAIVAVSLITKAPAREITEEFDSVTKMKNW